MDTCARARAHTRHTYTHTFAHTFPRALFLAIFLSSFLSPLYFTHVSVAKFCAPCKHFSFLPKSKYPTMLVTRFPRCYFLILLLFFFFNFHANHVLRLAKFSLSHYRRVLLPTQFYHIPSLHSLPCLFRSARNTQH